MRRAGIPLDDVYRARWKFVPFTGVGPLYFGMTHEEVAAALGESATIINSDGNKPDVHSRGRSAQFYQIAVTTYYRDSDNLSCIAVDALHGPQVTLDDVRLVGRVPSELAREFVQYTMSHGISAVYSQQGDPGADELGLLLRAQRAGDILLTRPVFVAREWADRVSDASEGFVPEVEWLMC
jgi:hypothetical protein